MNKKILLLDTSFSAKPIYDYLVTSGADVYVIGGRPEDALAKSVKNYFNLDYSNIEQVIKLIEQNNIDYIVPGGNDFSYTICSQINEQLGFYNIDSVSNNEIINSKEKFRRLSEELKLHVPRRIEIEEASECLPAIVKPVDAYSGHGVTVIKEFKSKELEAAVKLAQTNSKTGNYLIEEFVLGQLYSHSAFVSGGEIIIDFIAEEHCIVNPYAVDTSKVVNDFNSTVLNLIRAEITSIVSKLKLLDGLMHTQFIYNGDSFWIIEVTRRCPGDLYSRLIELSTGFPYAEYYARPFLDEGTNISNVQLTEEMIIRHTVTTDSTIDFHRLHFNINFDKLDYIPLALTGDQLLPSPYSRVAILFGGCNEKSRFDNVWNQTLKRKLYYLGN